MWVALVEARGTEPAGEMEVRVLDGEKNGGRGMGIP